MKANDLRVGNLIYNKIGEFCRIVTVNSNLIVQIDNGARSFQPIPLSPEILEKCEGFEGIEPYPKDIFRSGRMSVVLTAKKGNMLFFQEEGQEPVELSRDIDYLHQLQNWYYLINKGEELNYTP